MDTTQNRPETSREGEDDTVIDPVSLEYPTRLSKSMIWDVQRSYWERGSLAFSSGDVPFLLTTAPLIARAYARLIEGFVEDVAAGRFGEADPDAPVYVIDIGCGIGRLGYHVLSAIDHDYLAPMRVVYVFSDTARANVEFCANHPKLAPFFASENADVAQYDPSRDGAVVLEKAGVELDPGSVANPVGAIASYLLCAIPQDVISVIDGRIYEEHVEVLAENKTVRTTDDTFFEDIFVARYHVPFERAKYSERIAALVEKVSAERGSNHQFLLSEDWIQIYDAIQELSGHRSMLILADRQELPLVFPPEEPNLLPDRNTLALRGGAMIETQGFRPQHLYGMRSHGGCLSFPVDYGVVEAASELSGGSVLSNPYFASALRIGVMVEGERETAKVLRKRYRDSAVDPAPDDIWYCAHMAEVDEAPLEGLVADLRLSGYDSDVFMKVYSGLESVLREATGAIRTETLRVLELLYDRDYRVSESDDLAFGIAILLAKSEFYIEALGYFEKSKAAHGPRPQTSFNEAMCYLNVGDNDRGLELLNEALELDPGYKLAEMVRQKVLAGETLK